MSRATVHRKRAEALAEATHNTLSIRLDTHLHCFPAYLPKSGSYLLRPSTPTPTESCWGSATIGVTNTTCVSVLALARG